MMEEVNETKGNRKNLPIFSIVLAIGLAVLYFLHFNVNNEKPARSEPGGETPVILPASNSGSIAFVNSEVLLQNYKLVNKLSDQLDKQRQKKDSDFTARQNEYEQEADYFQEQVQRQSISEQSAQEIYQQLMVKQQDLYELQQRYSNELGQLEFEMNVVLLDSVRNYLERANAKFNFDYILNLDATGNIFVAKDTFDITSKVIEGLNMEYELKNTPE
jgi:outer membrane protein